MSLQAHMCIHMHLLGGGSHNKTICEVAFSKTTYHLAFESGHYDALLNPYVAMKRKRATDIRDYGHRVFEDSSGLNLGTLPPIPRRSSIHAFVHTLCAPILLRSTHWFRIHASGH